MAIMRDYVVISCRCRSKKAALEHIDDAVTEANARTVIYACSVPVAYLKLYIERSIYPSDDR